MKTVSFLTALLFVVSALPAQLWMGPHITECTKVIDESMQSTNSEVNVKYDGFLFIHNEFPSDIVVEIRNHDTGAVMMSVGVDKDGGVIDDLHDLPPGRYDIWVFEAGNPPGDDYGDLYVT